MSTRKKMEQRAGVIETGAPRMTLMRSLDGQVAFEQYMAKRWPALAAQHDLYSWLRDAYEDAYVAGIEEGKPALCDDCPPEDYLHNHTRCVACPRRQSLQG